MYNTIVVGFDESESSKAALKEASLRVREHGGRLLLVHAVFFDQEEFAILPSQMEERIAVGKRVCRTAKHELHEAYGMNGNVESFLCEGEPPAMIVDIANEKQADLIALGTFGRKGLKRLLMGSVTSQVILNASCDVLVVKKPCSTCIGSYHSIVVPYDGSESSSKALVRACALSKIDGAEVSVLYVIPRYEEMIDFFKTDAIKKSLFQEAEKIVARAQSIAVQAGVPIKATVREGHAGEKIVEIADTMKHDLIVVGTHGWSGVNKAVMGSTAERVIAYASCPILIAR
jgi:nucleotide-binding universal stress UspA family protein